MLQSELAEAIQFIKTSGMSGKYNLIRMRLPEVKTISLSIFDTTTDPVILKNNLYGNCYGMPVFVNVNKLPHIPISTFEIGYCSDVNNLLHLDSKKLTFNEKVEWYDMIYHFNNSKMWSYILNNSVVYETNIMTNYLSSLKLSDFGDPVIQSNTVSSITYGGTCTKCKQNYPYAEISDINTFKCWGCKNGF